MNVQAFLAAPPIMGKGMAGVFAGIAVLYLAIVLLRKPPHKKKKDTEQRDEKTRVKKCGQHPTAIQKCNLKYFLFQYYSRFLFYRVFPCKNVQQISHFLIF
jgi:hypothetical protein